MQARKTTTETRKKLLATCVCALQNVAVAECISTPPHFKHAIMVKGKIDSMLKVRSKHLLLDRILLSLEVESL